MQSTLDIELSDEIELDDTDTGKCHLINPAGLPFCGATRRLSVKAHSTDPLSDPCNTCGRPRCPECLQFAVVLEDLRRIFREEISNR